MFDILLYQPHVVKLILGFASYQRTFSLYDRKLNQNSFNGLPHKQICTSIIFSPELWNKNLVGPIVGHLLSNFTKHLKSQQHKGLIEFSDNIDQCEKI